MASIHTKAPVGGVQAAAISNHVVRTMSEYTGRGPTKARTHIHDDVVTVLLKDTLTTGERSLVSDEVDELDELVLAMRKAFQGTMRHDLIAGVEEILGRKVIAFMSDNHIDPDVAVEVFLLAAADAGPHGNGARGAAKTPGEAIAGTIPSPRPLTHNLASKAPRERARNAVGLGRASTETFGSAFCLPHADGVAEGIDRPG